MKRLVFLGLVFFTITVTAFGSGYGLIFYFTPEFNGHGADEDFIYSGGVSPWVSFLIGENIDVYLSGSVVLRYSQPQNTWEVRPELTRFMVIWRPFPGLTVNGGRFRFDDFNQALAEGLFDGAAGMFALGNTRLSLGAYYTGLLFKGSADVVMTGEDILDYGRELDYNDFAGTYFASRRLLAAAAWEIPSLFGGPHGLFLQGLAQFDLNGRENKLDTQYFSFQFLYSPTPVFEVILGGIAGFAERSGDADLGFGLLIDGSWIPPTPVGDMVTLGAHWGSGRINKVVGPLRPVTALSQGNVLRPELPGIILIRAGYTVQVAESLSLNLDARYFLRNDTETYLNPDLELKVSEKKALGAEIYAAATWVPMMDISVIFGGGAFFPGTGNAFVSGAPVLWKSALSLLVSF
jgi:hypothetical protein